MKRRVVGQASLMANDPLVAQRTCQNVLEALTKTQQGPTRDRWERAATDTNFIRFRLQI